MKCIILLVLLMSSPIFAQQNVSVLFVPYLFGSALKPDSVYIHNNDTISISECRFYISHAVISTSKNKEFSSDQCLLIDFKKTNQLILPAHEKAELLTLHFDFGIDSLTSVSGAMPGDLDPMHGMYWTWQSGYINFKLEGKHSQSKARNEEFQFHLGGYFSPFASIQHVQIEMEKSTAIVVALNLDALLSAVNIQKTNHIMRPCAEAVSLSKILRGQFVLK